MRIIISFFAVFLISSILCAQDMKVVNDLRMRSSLGIEKEFGDRFWAFSEVEVGLEEDISKLGKVYGEVGFGYSPMKYLDLSAKYRLTRNRKNYTDSYKKTHLFAISAEGKYKVDLVKLYGRVQYQNVDEELLWDDSNQEASHVFKSRLKVKYDVWGTKLTTYVSAEIYMVSGATGIDASKLKSIVGVEYPLGHRCELKIYYRNDRELKKYIPYTYHTMGFSYVFKFKK